MITHWFPRDQGTENYSIFRLMPSFVKRGKSARRSWTASSWNLNFQHNSNSLSSLSLINVLCIELCDSEMMKCLRFWGPGCCYFLPPYPQVSGCVQVQQKILSNRLLLSACMICSWFPSKQPEGAGNWIDLSWKADQSASCQLDHILLLHSPSYGSKVSQAMHKSTHVLLSFSLLPALKAFFKMPVNIIFPRTETG